MAGLVAKFDCALAAAWITNLVGPASDYTIMIGAHVPSSTLSALGGIAINDTGILLDLDDDSDGFFAHNTPPWQVGSFFDGPTGALPIDTDFAFVATLHNTGGTAWDIAWSVNGVPTLADPGVTLSISSAGQLQIDVGGRFSQVAAGVVYYVTSVEVHGDGGALLLYDDFSSGSFATNGWTVNGDATLVGAIPVPSDIGIRSAFGYATYDPDAFFVRLDDPTVPGLSFDGSAHNVSGYQIDRGRTYELDKTQAGTASLSLFDVSGIFDPTNPASPLNGLIGPMVQTKIGVQHGWTGLYTDLFTGFLESYKWSMTSDEALMMLAIGLVDGFEPLSRAEIPPGANGTTIFAATSDVQTRIDALLDIAPWPTAAGWRNINTGNVFVQRTVYNPQTSVLSAIQDAGDADFPGVANFFMRKGGAAAFLGRYPRFKPELFPQDVQFWTCGDKGAVSAFGGATIKNIEWELDNKNLINAALALPFGIAQTDIAGQLVFDAASIAQFGVRSKSLPDLLVDGQPMSTFQPALGANAVCLAYAQYYVSNYSQPQIRISTLEFEVVLGTRDTPSETWDLVLGVEIGDILTIATSNPGGGGFGKGTGGTESPTPAQFFVEGIHYNASFVDGVPILKLSLDVSPRGWFMVAPWGN